LNDLARRLRVLAARDWRFVPGGSRLGGSAKHLLVIAPRPMPTLDYYLGDLLTGEHANSHRILYDAALQTKAFDSTNYLLAGTRVVLVRMPDSRWASVLAAAGPRLVEVCWLVDDDIEAAREDRSLPPAYRWRLLAHFLRFKRDFSLHVDRVWASTALVASRYPAERVEVRPPRPLPRFDRGKHWVRIFYHGSAAHRAEHAFLRAIFERVQARSDRTVIEVIGDHAVYKLFRHVPRLRVVHPLRWPDYLAHLEAGRYDIGLAPLLDSPFNRARSGVKALEIAAISAAGLLSRRAPYTDYAHLPGLELVDDRADEWVEKILTLVERMTPPP
jgi:hypothetical protein